MNIVNLTPHALNIMPQEPDDPVVTIPPSGIIARCAVDRVQVDTITVDGITVPVNRTQFGAVTGLPDPQPDTIFVVSAVVAQAVPNRLDVFIVDDAIRDEQGRIIGPVPWHTYKPRPLDRGVIFTVSAWSTRSQMCL